MNVKKCRHCGKPNPGRPRGLCDPCYGTHGRRGVRDLYPSTSKHARLGSGVGNVKPAPCPHPVAVPVGSPERIAAYRDRAAAGFELFHPLDANGES